MKVIVLLFVLLGVVSAWGASPSHRFTDEENQKMIQHNAERATNDFINSLFEMTSPQASAIKIKRQPFAEYNEVGYVIFNDLGHYNSLSAKKEIAKNLPEGVTLVLFTGSKEKKYQKELFNVFSQQINKERIRIVYLPNGDNGFWARDGIPVPTWNLTESGTKEFAVVDAKYYKSFEADQEVSQLFGAKYIQHDYYHEGGNFLANNQGECLIVDNDRAVKISDQVFRDKYGCQKTIRFPHTKGIGHIDETVKLINDNFAITDDDEYAQILQQNGFTVQRVPRPKKSYETYVNSLYVNGTLFLPVFSQSGDEKAIKLYESFGYKVIPLDSRSLSNDGLGSIHCITMAYPPVAFNELLVRVGGAEVSVPSND